ncbi:MAG: DUF4147 domain-containing protein [Deltaproteobacteria bacterium]|nr:DUF4147 domain-containing protein [Deltaproteobacteria bacterium]
MTHGVSSRDAALRALRMALARLTTPSLVAHAAQRFVSSDLGEGSIRIIAVGKAAAAMSVGAITALGNRVGMGLVVTKDGHRAALPDRIEQHEAPHPWPDDRSTRAAELVLRRVKAGAPGGLTLFLISGGASSLVALPAAGITLAEKVASTRAVALAGASITELNCVRKHLSAVKGGRLGTSVQGRALVLVLSDVLGDDVSTIGGGLLVPDPTTFDDALGVVDKLGVQLPTQARALLEAGARGGRDDTPKPGDPRFSEIATHVLAGPDDLVVEVAHALGQDGIRVDETTKRVSMSVEDLAECLVSAAGFLAQRALATKMPQALVAGGEPVIRVSSPSPGNGGRAQHAALLCAKLLAESPPKAGAEVAILCAASDGTDGPTDNAGGVVDERTWSRVAASGNDPDRALAAHDSGSALAASGDLVTTGPTGTNLCDVFVVVARPLSL